MRHHPRIRGEHHPHPGLVGLAEIVALGLRDFAVLAQVILQHAVLLAFGLGVFGVVDIHRQPHRLLARERQLDPLVIDQAGVFDGVDPGADCGVDPAGAVGMGGNAQAPHMRLIGNRAQFRLGHLLLANGGVVRKDAARGADLDHGRAILALTAHLIAQLVQRIPHAFHLAGSFHRRGQAGLVTVPAGCPQGIARADNARPGDIAVRDCLGETDVVAVL